MERNENYKIEDELITVETAIPILSLVEMEIIQSENSHGKLKIQAYIKETEKERILHTDWSDTKIKVLKNDEAEQPLFHGCIKKLTCKRENEVWFIELAGISETVRLDREKKKRSFQNTEMTYKQVIQTVIGDCQNADFIWKTDENRVLGEPLIQYEETNWEFLKRLCSHFHGALFPDLKTGKPLFFFGMDYGKKREIEELEIKEKGFDGNYYKNGSYEEGKQRSQSLFMVGKTKENWQIGDYFLYEGRRLRIYAKRITFQKGELLFTYHMGTEGVFYRKKKYNEALAGLRLEGTIKRAEEEKVYLQLDMDQGKGADYPWPWAPETNNLCYCMPEKETKATLYIPTRNETEGRVVLAVISNSQSNNDTNPQNREFMTNHHKKIGLYPERIFLEGRDGALNVTLEDKCGIRMNSNTDISFTADGKVNFQGSNITMLAPVEAVYRTSTANIEMCRDFNFYAPNGVRTVGTGGSQEHPNETQEREKNQETEHWQVSYSAIAAVPMVDFANINGAEDAVDFLACGSVPKIAKGSTTVAMSEVMNGKKESECSYPTAFKSMDNYTVKGGYSLPDE